MSATIEDTPLAEVKLIRMPVHSDGRGWFAEIWRESIGRALGLDPVWRQDNVATSVKRVLRGLHWQLPPAAQAKLVRPVHGRILDVAVDIRRGSPTFGRSVAVELAAKDGTALYVPEGFAHGYLVLSPSAVVHYKADAEYAPELERALRWNDPALAIDWRVDDPILSTKDAGAPLLAEAEIFPEVSRPTARP